MPTAKPKTTVSVDTKDADAAVGEVIDPKVEMLFEFNGQTYRFKRKRLNATQFRLPMQKGFNELATEWLLGPREFQRFLANNLDEDETTPQEVFYDFVNALGEQLGTGNS